VVQVLDFLMDYESYLRKQRLSVTNRPEKIVIRYVSVVSLSSICMYSSRRFQFRLRADISKVTAHERIQYLYFTYVDSLKKKSLP
jgi:hypothetical protein